MTHSSKLWGQTAECERARGTPPSPCSLGPGPPPRTQSPRRAQRHAQRHGPGVSPPAASAEGLKGRDRQTQPRRPPCPSGCRTKVSALEREPSSPADRGSSRGLSPWPVAVASVHGVNAPPVRPQLPGQGLTVGLAEGAAADCAAGSRRPLYHRILWTQHTELRPRAQTQGKAVTRSGQGAFPVFVIFVFLLFLKLCFNPPWRVFFH